MITTIRIKKKMEVTLQVTTTVYDQMLNVNSEHSFWLTEKKLHSEFCYTQDIIVSFSQKQNESILASGRYNSLS